jgi:ABC-type branched-subunit amino acid transport system substrate-binding protein
MRNEISDGSLKGPGGYRSEAAARSPAWAAPSGRTNPARTDPVIRAVLITPLSGPLAGYGRAGATALSLWARHAGAGVDVYDAHPSIAAALSQVDLDLADVVFGPYGAGPAVAAARILPIPWWNHGGATARLARPRYEQVVNVLSPSSDYLAAVLAAICREHAGVQGAVLLHAKTGFGEEVAAGAVATATHLGVGVTRIAFDPGSGAQVASTAPDDDVLLVAGGFDDELAIARALLDRPWRASGFVAAGVDEVLVPLADRLEGVYGPCQWHAQSAPEPADGPDPAWFSATYERATATQPPYPAAAAFAAGVLWERAARDAASRRPHAVAAAARRLDTSTLFGAFRLDPDSGLQVGHLMEVVRWHAGRRHVVSRQPPG